MLTTPDVLINAGDLSQGTLSATQQLTNMFRYSVQAVYTGSPNGTIVLQASLDQVNWDTIDNSSVTINSSGNTVWNVSDVSYPWLKILYTNSGGSTGALTVNFFGRGF